MWWTVGKAMIAAVIIVTVSEIGDRRPRLGALLLTLPVVSILAFIFAWTNDRDMASISRLAREALIMVPLGLPFFVPLAFAGRLGLDFWPAFVTGVLLASLTIGLWFWLGPDVAG